MSKMKRVAATLLAVCMLMSLMVFPTVSATPLDETVTLGFGEVAWADGVCTVPVTASGASDSFGVRNMDLLVKFDPAVLQLDSVVGHIPDVTVEGENYPMRPSRLSTKVDDDTTLLDVINQNGCVYLLIVDSSTEHEENHVIPSGSAIVDLLFKPKEGQEGKTSTLSFEKVDAPYYASKEIVIGTYEGGEYQIDATATTTVTVPGPDNPPDDTKETVTLGFGEIAWADGVCTAPVTASGASASFGARNMDLLVKFDPAVLQLDSVVGHIPDVTVEGETYSMRPSRLSTKVDGDTTLLDVINQNGCVYLLIVDSSTEHEENHIIPSGSAIVDLLFKAKEGQEGKTSALSFEKVDAPYYASKEIVIGTYEGTEYKIDATATATVTVPNSQYTVTFVNDDNTEISSKQYDAGTEAANIEVPANPTKDATVEKTYEFAGWTPEIAKVTADATYTATYDEKVRQYTVKFVGDDDAEISSQAYDYGTEASAITVPTAPEKVVDGKTYEFKGWEPEIAAVTADATYKATYNEPVAQYTVKFLNDDGTEISSQKYDYGTEASAITLPANPAKEPTAEKTYEFAGWEPEIAAVTADATYKATYDEKVRQYTVTFVSEDGVEISSQKYDYGTEAANVTTPTPPQKVVDGKTYEFAGWAPTIVNVTADATYKPTYNEPGVQQYTVTFVNDDDTEISSQKYDEGTEASAITLPANPAKDPTVDKTYEFAGWEPEIAAVTADATYKATYDEKIRQYTVTFVGEDGAEISSQAYDYATEASAITVPTAPEKVVDGKTYTFAGWEPEIAAVTADATYKATYSAPGVQQYTVTFVNDDGTEISSQKYDEGTEASAITLPANPAKDPTVEKTYEFKGWEPEIAAVTADATYKATYDEKVRQYTVTFVGEDGAEISSQAYDYGTEASAITTPTAPAKVVDGKTYEFTGWAPTIVNVTADATYKATYSEPGVKQYTVTFVNDDGTEISSQQYAEGTEASAITLPANPTKAPTDEVTYEFAGWTPEIAKVTADATYKATYTEKKINTDPTPSQGCYIATSVYGSYDCPQVWTLRRFRDDVLGQTWYGRLFIKAYYATSPTLVKWFGDAEWFQNFWRDRLDSMVESLQDEGFESTPYQDQNW